MIDGETRFSDRQALSGTAVSENIVEFDKSGKDVASGEPVYLNVLVTKHDTAAPAMDIEVRAAAGRDMAGAAKIATFTLPAGVVGKGGPILSAPLPAKLARGYGRLNYALTGTAPAGFQVTAWLGMAGQTNLND